MATETLPQGPKAFAGWDSSIFMAWIAAMSDMMMTGGDPAQMADETLKNYGGLMHSLTEAAEEMLERERADMLKVA